MFRSCNQHLLKSDCSNVVQKVDKIMTELDEESVLQNLA